MARTGVPTLRTMILAHRSSAWERASSWSPPPSSSLGSPATSDSSAESTLCESETPEPSPVRDPYPPRRQAQLSPTVQQWLRDYQSRQQDAAAGAEEPQTPDSPPQSPISPMPESFYIQARMWQWTWANATRRQDYKKIPFVSPFTQTLMTFPRSSEAKGACEATCMSAALPSPDTSSLRQTGCGNETNMQTCSPVSMSSAAAAFGLKPQPAVRLPPSGLRAPPVPAKSSLRIPRKPLPSNSTTPAMSEKAKGKQHAHPFSPGPPTMSEKAEGKQHAYPFIPGSPPCYKAKVKQHVFPSIAPSPSTIPLPRFFPLRSKPTTAVNYSPQIAPIYKRLSSTPMTVEAAVRAHVRANETRHCVFMGIAGIERPAPGRSSILAEAPADAVGQDWRSKAMNSGIAVGKGAQKYQKSKHKRQNQVRMPDPTPVWLSPVAPIAEFRRHEDGTMEILGWCGTPTRAKLRRRVISAFKPFFGGLREEGDLW